MEPITVPAVPAVTTPVVTPGRSTSEYAMARLNQYAGLVMILTGAVAPFLADLHSKFPDIKLIATALIIVGGLKSILAVLGYGQSRAEVKAATMNDAAKELLK